MATPSLQALILAAGRSTRFNTEQTKLSFIICGREMILYPITLLNSLKVPLTVVVGYQKEMLQEIVTRHNIHVNYVEQKEQHGPADAVLCSKSYWSADNILIMNGDVPLVTQDLITELIEKHNSSGATITFMTAHNADPSLADYGRVVRENGSVHISEHCPDANAMYPCCVNAGIYIFKRDFLEKSIGKVSLTSHKAEQGIAELIGLASSSGLLVETIEVPFDCVRGVNTLKELWAAEHIKKSELISYWMSKGVRFSTAQNVHIDIDVTIGSGTFIGSGALLLGKTKIGQNCWIDAYSFLENATIQDRATILSNTVITASVIGHDAQVGPFAHVRNNSIVGAQSCVGNFVEVNRSTLGTKSKAKHLSYLGDAVVGNNVNIGAGTVTCNYDGHQKHTTTIEDGAFVGSNNTLIAPITIGEGSFTAAGSTITQSVPEDGFAISRSPQTTKEKYAGELRERIKNKDGAVIPKQTGVKQMGESA